MSKILDATAGVYPECAFGIDECFEDVSLCSKYIEELRRPLDYKNFAAAPFLEINAKLKGNSTDPNH